MKLKTKLSKKQTILIASFFSIIFIAGIFLYVQGIKNLTNSIDIWVMRVFGGGLLCILILVIINFFDLDGEKQ